MITTWGVRCTRQICRRPQQFHRERGPRSPFVVSESPPAAVSLEPAKEMPVMKRRYLTLAFALFLSAGCSFQRPSPWKIHGGLKECLDMCRVWDLEFVAMVGVGDQGPSTEGASACVCQARKTAVTAEV